jgi:hypothetical protein
LSTRQHSWSARAGSGKNHGGKATQDGIERRIAEVCRVIVDMRQPFADNDPVQGACYVASWQ